MTPERADLILAGVLKSLQMIIDELEDLEATCPNPQVRHLRLSVEQMKTSLGNLLARDEGRQQLADKPANSLP